MMKWEDHLRTWLIRHAVPLGYAAVALLGLLIRWSFMPLIVADTEFFYIPWLNTLKESGVQALLDPALQFNYTPMNLYLWALAAKLFGSFDTLMVVKALRIVEELALCAACYALICALVPKARGSLRRFLGFSVLLLNPVLILNAAGWGQVDAGYTLFCVLSVILLLKQKPEWALCMMGVALSYKLQAAFLLPLFVIAYFCGRKKFSLLWFLAVPGIWVISGVPMIFFGQSPLYAVQVYLGQAEQYTNPTFNCPNLFAVMGDAIGAKQQINGMLSRLGMALCFGALGGMAVWLMRTGRTLTDRTSVLLGAWCVLCCLFFLPRMHERYGIVGEMLLLCWAVACAKPRGFAYVLLGLLPTLSAYAEYMFRYPFFPLQWGGVMNMVLLGLLTLELLHELRTDRLSEEIAA
ncbi:MAG: glycosyltransferase 87 family protein [Clostridia bacterium]